MPQGSDALLTVLLADIPGNAQLHERVGAEEARWAIDRCLNRAGRCIEAAGGQIVNTIAHEIMAVFQSPASALQAAIEMQQRVGVLPPVSGMKMSIRVGLAYGPASIQDTEITGDAAKVAAWLAGIAQPGDILTDARSLSAIPQPLRDLMQDRGPATHIGRMDGVHLYAYSSTPVQSRPSAPLSKKAAVLILSHGGSAIRFSGESQALTIGRESTCDMVIKTPKVSRLHAKIELRDHRFVLVDESTNGTFIKIGKEPEIRIHHEPFVLRGKGQLSFASSTHEPQADLLSFEVSESV